MRRLLIGISALVVALMLVIGGTDHARAGVTDQVVTLASHAKGDMIAVVAYCMSLEELDYLIDQAIRPGDDSRYQEIMTIEENVRCLDHRFYGAPPVRGMMDAYVKTIETDEGLFREIWKVLDIQGEAVFTWVAHHGEDA